MENQKETSMINPTDFEGKTVAELLEAMPGEYSEMAWFDTGRPGILGGCNLKYDGRWLVIQVDEYQHLDRFNASYDWDFELFKQETITKAGWEE